MPMSRRVKAQMPMPSMITSNAARTATDSQSNWPASGRWLIVQPNQVSFESGASSGTGAE